MRGGHASPPRARTDATVAQRRSGGAPRSAARARARIRAGSLNHGTPGGWHGYAPGTPRVRPGCAQGTTTGGGARRRRSVRKSVERGRHSRARAFAAIMSVEGEVTAHDETAAEADVVRACQLRTDGHALGSFANGGKGRVRWVERPGGHAGFYISRTPKAFSLERVAEILTSSPHSLLQQLDEDRVRGLAAACEALQEAERDPGAKSTLRGIFAAGFGKDVKYDADKARRWLAPLPVVMVPLPRAEKGGEEIVVIRRLLGGVEENAVIVECTRKLLAKAASPTTRIVLPWSRPG